ncbi:MAG: hypothetical protein DRP11_00860 [Candidatus Aenigmatarchaeota archaeon]|nr:MAG: hypothetical protein DRP11_00860 [Candidatus Aenigmarchaeota archaeon]
MNFQVLKKILQEESRKFCWGLILFARDELRREVIAKKPKLLLDIGCHNRLLEATVKEWLKTIKHRVETVGIDVVKYEVKPEVMCDGGLLPFRNNVFDFITIVETLEHIPDYVNCLRECYRVLKKNGILFIQSVLCTSPNAYEGDESHFHVLHVNTLSRLLEWLKMKIKKRGIIKNTFYLFAIKP